MTARKPPALIPVLEGLEEFRRLMGGRRPVVFLDYDGTLTPIVPDPAAAVIAPSMRERVRALAALCPVAIVSGRSLERLMGFLRLDNVVYAGSHGLDIIGPPGSGMRHTAAEGQRGAVEKIAGEIAEAIRGVPGAEVELSGYTAAVHYRNAPIEYVAAVKAQVDLALARNPGLRLTHGKKVWEIRPGVDWDKGKAVLWILDALGLDPSTAFPFYVGDDVTDEDAFRVVAGWGVAVLVAASPRDTAATHWVSGPGEVGRLLEGLARVAEDAASSSKS